MGGPGGGLISPVAPGGAGGFSPGMNGADGATGTSVLDPDGLHRNGVGGGGGGGGGAAGYVGNLLPGRGIKGGNGGNGGKAGDYADGATPLRSANTGLGGNGGAGASGAILQGTGTYLGTVLYSISGGDGGNGGKSRLDGDTLGHGSNGGSGGAAMLVDNARFAIGSTAIAGGNGGSGDQSGAGGAGIAGTQLTIENAGRIRGGNGGQSTAGSSSVQSGAGGAGIVGIDLVIQNFGQITGGDAGTSSRERGNGGAGINGSRLTIVNTGTIGGGESNSDTKAGAGISGANINIVNSGTISGGMNSANAVLRGNAINFTAGVNSLELRQGAQLIGKAVGAAGSTNTLILGHSPTASTTTPETFDTALIGSGATYQNFTSFRKTGASTWALLGTTSAVTPWSIEGGVLSISSDAALGASSSALTLAGGTLQVLDTLTTNRAVGLTGDATISVAADKTLRLNGIVDNTGSLTKTGAGTLSMSNANLYAGGTTIKDGRLIVADRNALGSGSLTARNGSVVQLTSSAAFNNDGAAPNLFRHYAFHDASVVDASAPSAVLGGEQSFYGNSKLNAAATDAIAGGMQTFMATSTLNASTARAVSNGSQLFSGASVLNASATAAIAGGKQSFYGTSTLNVSAASAISGGAQWFYDNSTLNATTAGAVGAGVTLTLNGASTLNANATNALSGGSYTLYNNSTLNVGAVGALSRDIRIGFSNLFGGTGGTLRLNGHDTFLTGFNSGGFEGSGIITNDATTNAVLTVGNPGADYSVFSGIIQDGVNGGKLGLTKTGDGVLILSGANRYTGDTVVSGGKLMFGLAGQANRLGGRILVDSGELAINSPGTLTTSRDARFADGTTLSLEAAASGPSFTMAGLTLGNGVSFNLSGLSDQSGRDQVVIRSDSVIAGDFATVTVGGFHEQVDYLSFNTRKSADGKAYLANYDLSWTTGNSLAKGNFTIQDASDRFTLNVALGDQAANAATHWNGKTLTKLGAGTLVLSADNHYTGGTEIVDGTLQLGDGGMTGSIQGDVTNNGTLAINRADTLTYAGLISGYGALRHVGTGTTVLTADHRYTGLTTIAAGTLQLGNGGTSGSIRGDVLNDGVLAFNRSDSLIYTGRITGSGVVRQIGPGTTTLAADQDYTGGTAILAGTLQIGDGHSTGSIKGDVLNNGTLAFNRYGTLNYVGTIAGSGAVRQIGGGTTILTGDHRYTGGTVIEAGILQLGNGGSTGSIQGDIVNNGVLVLNRAGRLDLAGAISGGGSLELIGPGLTVLAGSNSYTGDTRLSAGTLQVSREANLGAASSKLYMNGGTLATAADLTLNRAVAMNQGGGSFDITAGTTLTLAGKLQGSGPLITTGGGRLLLTGDARDYVGTTTVDKGLLSVNGRLGGYVNVVAGGTLGGNGTIGFGAGPAVTVASGGTLAPGNSIGTLNIDGDLTMAAGARYAVEVDPASQRSDLIRVSGKAMLNGGSVAHVGSAGAYDLKSTYTILSAGTLSGRFDTVSSDFVFLTPTLGYDASNVYLTLERNKLAFASVAQTRNQRAAAQAIDSIGIAAGHAVYSAIAQLPDDQARIRDAFDLLSGEIHASAKTALIEDSRFIRDAAVSRLRSAFNVSDAAPGALLASSSTPQAATGAAAGPAVWSQALGAWGRTDGNGNAASLDRNASGFLMGADAPIFGGAWRLGIMAGYTHSSFKARALASSGSSDSYSLGLYGGTERSLGKGRLGLRAGLSHGWNNIDTKRSVGFATYSDQLKASYQSRTLQAFGDVGYRLDAGRASFEPFVNLAHVRLDTDGYAEQGQAAALSARGQAMDTTFSTLGLRAATDFVLGRVPVAAKVTLGWRHAYGDTTPLARHTLSAGDAYTVAGVPIARNTALVEAGMDLTLSRQASLGLAYNGQLASGTRQHGVKASLAIRF
ncbi:autotransporter domain-containing protein [Achromobacter sp. Marseille-Q0513]|uniref:autotransporter domain-containing protein n=1 Tax=Achromobacter sp. Marseille-Q0513 TaxID=2829161 RepID=UPI001BA7F7FA|nr:autotransporter domain-containing protein [Achromobacter sp. Marseille-Q0513]